MMNKINLSENVLQHDHNHISCLQQAIERAEAICKERGERFTTLRRQVLTLIWDSHEPVKAYDLLEGLKQYHPGSKPVTVYRALDFLRSLGLVHKIESLNAFLGCGSPESNHDGQFFICSECGIVLELDNSGLRSALNKEADSMGFSIDKVTVELTGTCENCA